MSDGKLPPKISPSRKLVLGLLLMAATWLGIEAISFVALTVVNRAMFSFRAFSSEMRARLSTELPQAMSARTNLNWNDYVEVLHPYFGYVADPESNKAAWDVSDFGFIFSRNKNPVPKRSNDRLVVALFGGSFANGLYVRLAALLESKSAELNKKIDVINFSSAGYKQPQQLMVLSYLMALGGQFDIVINVDGFNDISLAAIENIPNHVNPFYPRGWDRRTADTISQADIRNVGQIEYLKAERMAWARAFLRARLYFSPTFCLVWQSRDRSVAGKVFGLERSMVVSRAAVKSYTMHGPKYEYVDEAHLFNDLAEVWKNSSMQMRALCEANGARYYHFLQPNQYVPDSKPMRADEEKRAITRGHPYEHGVIVGYPLLVNAGGKLKAGGLSFTDLTHVFDHVREPVYADDCCHLNAAGYDIVAERIYREVSQR